jgi:hypothetical protein
MFLTLEQASEMSKEDCELHLKKLARKYNLNKPLTECWTEVWPILDEITNTLLYLEDRIKYLGQLENVANANTARWANK